MSHFAEIDENGIVIRVIVASKDYIKSGKVGDPSKWIQTSYNTIHGVHRNNGTPLRKNYAGIGYTYDKNRDMFIPPKKFDSWILNEEKGIYEAPKPIPQNGIIYHWNEQNQEWQE